MWIAIGLIIIVIAAIVFVLLSPLGIVIECGKNDSPQFQFRLWGKTLEATSDKPENPFTRFLKKQIGVSAAKQETDTTDETISEKVRKIVTLLQTVLEQITKLLPHCTMKSYEIRIVCIGEDAADAAINYGKCCAAVYPITGFIASKIPTKASGVNVDIQCDYLGNHNEFSYNFFISVKLLWLAVAYIRSARSKRQRRKNKNTATAR